MQVESGSVRRRHEEEHVPAVVNEPIVGIGVAYDLVHDEVGRPAKGINQRLHARIEVCIVAHNSGIDDIEQRLEVVQR